MPVLRDSFTMYATVGVRMLQDQLEEKLGTEYDQLATIGRGLTDAEFSEGPGKKIFWTHNNPFDYLEGRQAWEAGEALHFNDENRFTTVDDIVFTSRFQRTLYIDWYKFEPQHYSKLHVIPNGIDPITPGEKPTDKIKIIYASRPTAGLGILYAAFTRLCHTYSNLELHVFSDWAAWGSPDMLFGGDIIEKCKAHPKIVWHGDQPNSVVREHMATSHIFAYPSTFPEVACLPLMEAMSSKCLCIHPKGGALEETAQSKTFMYDTPDNHFQHTERFMKYLDFGIKAINSGDLSWFDLDAQKEAVDSKHNWTTVLQQWKDLIDA